MSIVIMIKGDKRPETIFDNEQFARLLDERLGYDAAQYFRETTDLNLLKENLCLTDEEILNNDWCSGECDKVQRTQEHYENLLKYVGELAQEIYNGIMDGYSIGCKRTKKEQLSINKAIEILRVVKKNT